MEISLKLNYNYANLVQINENDKLEFIPFNSEKEFIDYFVTIFKKYYGDCQTLVEFAKAWCPDTATINSDEIPDSEIWENSICSSVMHLTRGWLPQNPF